MGNRRNSLKLNRLANRLYRDSFSFSRTEANYYIARRRFIDARRRFIDDEIVPQASKFSKLCDKVAEKLKQFATDHPTIAKVIRGILKIRIILGSITTGVYAANTVRQLIALCSATKGQLEAFKGATGFHPGVFIAIKGAIVLINAIEIFAQRKLVKALTPDQA